MSDDGAATIYCTYGQCADATVPCPRCTAKLTPEGEEITYAEFLRREQENSPPEEIPLDNPDKSGII